MLPFLRIENVVRFRFAHRGRCLARVEGVEEPVNLERGDPVIILQDAAHTLNGRYDQNRCSAHEALFLQSPSRHAIQSAD